MKQALSIAVILLLFTSMVFAEARPWTNMQEYTDTINDPEKNMAVNEYVYRIANFIKEKCPPEYCKHVLIVGDDYVIPQERKINPMKGQPGHPDIIYSDEIYITKTTRGVGETIDVLNGEPEIVFVVPNSMDSRFREAIDNLKNNMSTKYGIPLAGFLEYKDNEVNCSVSSDSVFWNKSIVVIGENNALLNCNTFWKNSKQIFDMFPSPWGIQTENKKVVLLIKTNLPNIVEDAANVLTYDNTFYGEVKDNDGDGWTDKEEFTAHTNPLDKFENPCTKLPGLKTLFNGLDDVDYWADMANRLVSGQFQTGAFGTQSILVGFASDFGKLYGMYAGITAGARDDYKFVTADFWSLAGTIVTASLNTENQRAAMVFLDGFFTDNAATQCAAARHGVNIGDDATQVYFNEVLPSLYEQAENTDPILPVILDDFDRDVFNHSFVAAYHVGYIGEQVAIGKGVDEALKSLKLGKLLQALNKTAVRILGNPVFENAPEAVKGLERIARATDEGSLIKFEEQLTKKYGATQGYERLKTISQYFEQAAQSGVPKETLDTASKALTKYEGIELLLKSSGDVQLLSKFQNSVDNMDDIYAIGSKYNLNYNFKFIQKTNLNTFGKTDVKNRLIEIYLVDGKGRVLTPQHLTDYIMKHETTHLSLGAKEGLDVKNFLDDFFLPVEENSALQFEEYFTDRIAKHKLGSSDLYNTQLKNWLNSISDQELATMSSHWDYPQLALIKRTALETNHSIASRIDALFAGRLELKQEFDSFVTLFETEADNLIGAMDSGSTNLPQRFHDASLRIADSGKSVYTMGANT